ncbi:MAG: single-stranded-DNA-specific exonuclease RecJ, partial [Pseudomonadota bacterium]
MTGLDAYTAFLGVERSLNGRRWVGPGPEEDRLSEALVQQTGIPPAVARVLVRRGVSPEDTAGFLNPSLRDLLPDPMGLRDMGPAADRFLDAVAQRQKMAIFADYDVDGGSSAALILDWLRHVGLGPYPSSIRSG